VLVERFDRLGALVLVLFDDASRPQDVVRDDGPALGQLRQDGFVVVDVVLLVGVDEDEVERALERFERLERGPDAVIDPIGDAGFLGIAAGDRGRLLIDVEADNPAALGQVERHRDRGVAGEGADLEDSLGPREPDEPAEELPLERPDHHLGPVADRAGLLLEAAEEVCIGGRVLERVTLDVLVDDEAHSTLPTRTHALWPPRPIAFESATSTWTSRASFGT
jgi:hypothetical protein